MCAPKMRGGSAARPLLYFASGIQPETAQYLAGLEYDVDEARLVKASKYMNGI